MNLQRNDRFTLVEALDRLIGKGVSVSGDLSISVADIDLVYLGVRLLLCSADEVPELRHGRARPPDPRMGVGDPIRTLPPPPPPAAGNARSAEQSTEAHSPQPRSGQRRRDVIEVGTRDVPEKQSTRLMDLDPGQIERDLCRLVLTIVELLRQLMERQAVRRMESGTLEDQEVERLGLAFARLEEKMEELKTVFGLEQEDLNLDLGPLGTLV